MRILVVDDELNILKLFTAILTSAGYEVVTSTNGSDALDIYYDQHIDMVICDEMMPIMSGNELVESIREDNKNIPIIMVTAKSSIDDKAKSYDLGIDEYIVKPFDKDELMLRINAIFRRAKISTDKQIKVKDIILDYNTHTITNTVTNVVVNFSKTEFEILFKLLSYPEKAFTKWQLYHEFWGLNSDTDESIVKVFILKIRKKIEQFPEIEIQTIMGIGYKGVRHEG